VLITWFIFPNPWSTACSARLAFELTDTRRFSFSFFFRFFVRMGVFYMNRWIKILMALLLGVAIFGSPAAARADLIDFSGVGGGTTSYAGGAAPLVGSNLTISSVTGVMTAAHQGQALTISGGLFNFTTGSFASSTSTTWVFSAGGSFSITGTIPAQSGFGGTSGTLLSGTLVSATVIDLGMGNFKADVGVASDPINSALAAYYGEPASPTVTGFTVLFQASGSSPSAFTSSAIASTDVGVTPVPEPGTIVLALTGLPLLGIGKWLRRRRTVA
jgi:hypothetical protein